MGAHVILIDPIEKKAIGTTAPLGAIKNFTGCLAMAPEGVLDYFNTHYPEYRVMPYMIVESDAHGQLHHSEVKFDDGHPNGYYFNRLSGAW